MGATMAPTAAARITAAISASMSVKPMAARRAMSVLIVDIGCPLAVVAAGVGNDLQRLRLVDPAGGVVRLTLRWHRAPIGDDKDGVHPVNGIDWHFLQIGPKSIGFGR